jgi:hypothetical protein
VYILRFIIIFNTDMNCRKAGMGLDSSRLMEGTLRRSGLQRKLKKKRERERDRWPVTNKSHQISDEINLSFVVTGLPVAVHQ